MPIAQFLNGENFDPETTHAMGLALELACVALQLRNRYDAATTAVVATKIIAMAKAGECCATTLCDRALSELGYDDYDLFRVPPHRRTTSSDQNS